MSLVMGVHKPRVKSKYKAVPTVIDGIRFDSKLEAKRYSELKLLQQAGEISHLEHHVRWPLVLGRSAEGLLIVEPTSMVKVGEYEVDFQYFEPVNRGGSVRVFEDCKGMITALAKWKIKHFELQNGIKVRIIPK